jgi:hypothetical protein
VKIVRECVVPVTITMDRRRRCWSFASTGA